MIKETTWTKKLLVRSTTVGSYPIKADLKSCLVWVCPLCKSVKMRLYEVKGQQDVFVKHIMFLFWVDD